MHKQNLLKEAEKERILKIPVIIKNPLNIKYKDTDILFGNIIINEIVKSTEVVCSVCRGMNNIRCKAMLYQNKSLKIISLGFKINKIVGECIIKNNKE